MDSSRASVSLNGSSTTAAAADSTNAIPHYLRPFTGSCHDICKFGRRRALDEQTTKPLHKTTGRVSMVVPSHQKKATARLSMVVPSQATARLPMVVPSSSPSSYAKSFPPRAKSHTPRQNTSPGVKRGIALAQVQVKESSKSVGSGMSKQRGSRAKKPARVDPSPPRGSPNGVRGKRRRNEDESLPSNTATMVELLPPPFQEEDGRRIKMPRTKTESNEFEFEFEDVVDGPSPSSHGEDGEESDKLLSDTTVSRGSTNHDKRRRKNRVVNSGDDHNHNHNHNQPVKIKFRVGKTMHPHEGDNAPRRHKFRAIRMDKIGADDSTSDIFHVSLRTGPPSRAKDRHRSSKIRHRRVRCGKARIVVLEDRRGDPRRKDALFNNVIEETASKLAERRKGMVKSLVGAFETLISIQERKCVFQLKKMNG